MQLICISRGSYGYGKQLAEKLAQKLGYPCISREELTDRATDHGIPVGKIEMAILKHQPLSEALGIEVDRYKAFITEALCEKAFAGGVVYHGRTGHLVLQGLSNVLRVRAIADEEARISMAMERMNLNRKKAKEYNDQVDEDRRRWIRALYNVDWDDPSLYDVTINSARLSLENSAASLVQMAQLPDFQITPASRQVLDDLLLGSKCRLAIGKDERTRGIKAAVQAEKGNVSVTYPPWQAKQSEAIAAVLKPIDEVRSLVCTVATTNILYIQERFDPDAESFSHLVEIAEKWNAAVELVRMADSKAEAVPAAEADATSPELGNGEHDGGILDDVPEVPSDCEEMGCGVPETMSRLIKAGRAGAVHTVYGGAKELVDSLSRTENYNLVVVGDVYLSRGEAVRQRLKRDLVGLLADRMRIPVIGSDELKTHYLFGPRQWLNLIGLAAMAALIYFLVLTYQTPILEFLTAPGTQHRVLATVLITLSVPFAAFVIGGVAHNVFKLAKLE